MTQGTPQARWHESLAAAAARAYEATHGSAIHDDRRGFRLAMGARQAVAVALAIVALAGAAWWFSKPIAGEPLTMAPSVSASAIAGGLVVVDVGGAVARPGVLELPAGTRVGEAIEAAGGSTEGADLAAINLARVVVDGEQIRVPLEGEETAESSTVSINTATAEQLDELPGIGEVLAARIVADREKNGPFTSVDDLARVSGVGAAIVDSLAGLATV